MNGKLIINTNLLRKEPEQIHVWWKKQQRFPMLGLKV